MKATEQHFPLVLFVIMYKVVLTFESVSDVLKCDCSTESYSTLLSRGNKRVQLQWQSFIHPIDFMFHVNCILLKDVDENEKENLGFKLHSTDLLSSSSLPPRSGLSVGDIHSKWLCFCRWRAKKRSAANSVGSDWTFPTGTWKYCANSSCVCWENYNESWKKCDGIFPAWWMNENDVLFKKVTQAYSEKRNRLLYHWATGDSWELRALN